MCANEAQADVASVGFLAADWPAPPGIFAGTTTRWGGISIAPFDHLNLATHVGDDPLAVAHNRARLDRALNLPATPRWLDQVHGIAVAEDSIAIDPCPIADAAYSRQPNAVLAVLTADCLPVVFVSADGQEIACAHAGWRGLAAGVLEATIARFTCPAASILAWMGPAIGPDAFEVGDEVRNAFINAHSDSAAAFVPGITAGKWQADLFQLARQRLQRAGLHSIFGGGLCTVRQPERFYSYRRAGGRCGRMATLIWRNSTAQERLSAIPLE